MSNYEKCSVGISLNEDCNSLTFCCLIGKTPVESLSDSDKQLVFLGTNCKFTDEDSICYHEKFYLSHFENLSQYCSEPWKQHSKQDHFIRFCRELFACYTGCCSKFPLGK